MIDDFEKRLKYDGENTSLPDKPDMTAIQDLAIEVNRAIVLNEGDAK